MTHRFPPPETVPLAPLPDPGAPPEAYLAGFHEVLRTRRTVREFSDRPVSREAIEALVRCASTAPSGANKQPWRFVCVGDPELKRRIREAAEHEERLFYGRRANEAWLADLAALGTTEDKPFLERAPWLVVVFKLARADDGSQVYYPEESVGIAVGMFLLAAHLAGLATLTHTPSPMRFLLEVLERPDNERPYMLIPVGYPAEGCRVPAKALERKPLSEIMVVR
ncbi:MAG: nitroreductase family protein [Planctomycetota bacterium]